MNFRIFISLIALLLLGTSQEEVVTWEIKESIKKVMPSVKSAEYFSIFEGELAYVENNVLHIGDKTISVSFSNIRNFLKYKDNYYVCPRDLNAKIIKITPDLTLSEIDPPDSAATGYTLQCLYYSSFNRLLVGFIGYKNIYNYDLELEKWDPTFLTDDRAVKAVGLLGDSIIYLYTTKNYQNYVVYMEHCQFNKEYSMCPLKRNLNSYRPWEGSPEIEAGFYIYGNEYVETPENANRRVMTFWKTNSELDIIVFDSPKDVNNQVNAGDWSDNYYSNFGLNRKSEGKFIKGLSISDKDPYFAYQFLSYKTNIKYWGVMDLWNKLSIFNSDEEIDEEGIYPILDIEGKSKSVMIKKNGVYSMICVGNSDNKDGKCPQCDSGKDFVVDSQIGNQCTTIPDSGKSSFKNLTTFYKCEGSNHTDLVSGYCTNCSSTQFINEKTGSCLDKCTGEVVGIKCKNCKDYNKYLDQDSKKCTEVPDGFYVNDNNEKMPCDSSCDTCDDGRSCKTCKEGYTKKDGVSLCVPCFFLCKTCSGVGDSNSNQCTNCIAGALTLNNGNCERNCEKYWYIESGEVKCTESCQGSAPFLYEEMSRCISSCKDISRYKYNSQCLESCPQGFEENSATYTCDKKKPSNSGNKNDDEEYDPELDLCFFIEIDLEDFEVDKEVQAKAQQLVKDYLKEENNEYLVQIIKGKKIKMTIYKKAKCANKISKEKGITYANLTEAQDKLADANSISRDSTFVVGQIEMAREDEVTDQLSGYVIANSLGEPYDLEPISDEKVNITYPVSVDQLKFFERGKTLSELGVDIYNPEDPFFNDYCYPYSDEEGKDVTIKDRRENIFQNGSFCESDCSYKKMDFKNARVTCECNLNPSIFDRIFQNGDAGDFPIKLNLENLLVIRCYNLVFSSEKFPVNAGGWVQLIFILGQVGLTIWLFILGFSPMKNFIVKSIEEERMINLFAPEVENNSEKANPPRKISAQHDISSLDSRASINGGQASTPTIMLKKAMTKVDMSVPVKLALKDKEVPENFQKRNTVEPTTALRLSRAFREKEMSPKNLNDLSFEEAMERDKRSIWKFYLDALLETLSFTKPFIGITPLEPIQIRLIEFLLMLGFYLAMNAIFYDDSYIEARYKAKGTGFLYLLQNELERTVYASLCTCVINMIIDLCINFSKLLSRTLKNNEEEKDIEKIATVLLKSIKIRLIVFLVVQYIIMLFFWYYVSAFCAMYQQNQGPLFISAVLTIVFCSIWQGLIILLATIFRFIGLKYRMPLLYSASQCLL